MPLDRQRTGPCGAVISRMVVNGRKWSQMVVGLWPSMACIATCTGVRPAHACGGAPQYAHLPVPRKGARCLPATQTTPQPVPAGYHTVTPWIISRNSDRLLVFLKEAFGAEELARVYHQ